MVTSILATKLYAPPLQPGTVHRPRLLETLNKGLHCKLTLISAAAGFGKTTLVREWISECKRPVAWVSLDKGDNDPMRFLVYLAAALQTIAPNIGEGILQGGIRSPQPPPAESLLTILLNEIAEVSDPFLLVLDDYHLVEVQTVARALTFLIDHLPPQMHLVLVSREDPQLPLPRYRAGGQMNELRAADLRFHPAEAAAFLNQSMGLQLTPDEITALENRTEGWIAGLQLAAISLRGQQDTHRFIRSFTGSHHFVLDFLVEEVLHQQSEDVQAFLLRTSILERLCGPLCDTVLLSRPASGQETLQYLEQSNLFLVPLDSERRWYRYHHLFGEFLRQRLPNHSAACAGTQSWDLAAAHIRASNWFEENGLYVEAFSPCVRSR